MANLNSVEQKSTEKDYTTEQSPKDLDEPNDNFDAGGYTPTIVLALLAIIPMIILIILFSI